MNQQETTISGMIVIPLLQALSTLLIAYLAHRLGVRVDGVHRSNQEQHHKLDRLVAASNSSVRGSIAADERV